MATPAWAAVRLALPFILLAASNSRAQSITATKWDESSAALESDNSVEVLVSQNKSMVPLAALVPLASGALDNIPSWGLLGPVYMANDTSYNDITGEEIAFISCDETSYKGNIGPLDVFSAAQEKNATAVVWYTDEEDYCELSGYSYSAYWSVYSFKSASAAGDLRAHWAAGGETRLYATVSQSDDDQAVNKTAPTDWASEKNGTTVGNMQQSPLGPSPSTAVAMIILYSITGIITALFLIIIITGAVRAHRHPERYGPRNIMGRPRQSRARGMARAMLDSLPIVKFGERQDEATAKPGDVEMADGSSAAAHGPVEVVEHGKGPSEHADPIPTPATETPGESSGQAQMERRDSTASHEGIAPAVAGAERSAPTGPHDEETQGCSICTEDFEIGQDQRVLPCDHRFHPECVDPWLLNVSGTCPLCRIDLRPQNAEDGELDEDGNPIVRDGDDDLNNLPPPLPAGQPANRNSRRRSFLSGIRSMVIPDSAGPQDRAMAVRRLRLEAARRERERQQAERENGQEQGGTSSTTITPSDGRAAPQPMTEEEGQRRRRFRNLFGIRTRQTGHGEESGQRTGSIAE